MSYLSDEKLTVCHIYTARIPFFEANVFVASFMLELNSLYTYSITQVRKMYTAALKMPKLEKCLIF